jgi:flavin-dependent dehydrogenase
VTVQTSEFDVLIVGARAAGASLGLLLARQGRRVLLVDRDAFPSDTHSTHFMNPVAVGFLRQLGVLEPIEAAGFRRIIRHRTWVEDCHIEGPAGPHGAYSLAPRRNVLDPLLVEHATAAGAKFMDCTRAESLIREDGRVCGAVLRTGNGEPCAVRATVTVGADGKYSKVAEWVAAEKYNEVPALRPVYYAYFNGVEPLPEATVEIFYGGGQIAFLFPMRVGEDCLAVEIQPEEYAEFRADVRGSFEGRLRRLPGMERRLRSATLEHKVIGARGIDNYFRKPHGPGWALTGDAAYLKDPSTGLGMGDALKGSMLLADALKRWFDGDDWDNTMSEFQAVRDEFFTPGYQATLATTRMRDPDTEQASWIKAICGSPGAARTLAHQMPTMASQIYPPGLVKTLGAIAKMYADAAARTP